MTGFKIDCLFLCLLASYFNGISYSLDSSPNSYTSTLASTTEGSSSGEPEQDACLETCNLSERNLSVCTVTTGTLVTHRNIEAAKIKGNRITLEKSAKGNQAFKEQNNRFIVQMSAPHDQLVYIARKGFVDVATKAYNQHHHLVWRPDDVWLAIITQFSLYVIGNSEELRSRFVDFNGTRELSIETVGTLFTVDFGNLAKRMVDEQIVKNIKDPTIAEWLIPKFSTTTENDRIVASINIMATLQNYFRYRFQLLCGLPSITLLGTANDWRLLRSKVDRLLEFDNEDGLMKKWWDLLSVVLDEFVKTKCGIDNMDFWDRICHYYGGFSGPTYLSGWITTFAVFNSKGKWQGNHVVRQWWTVDITTRWPAIDTADIPSGTASVPVLINDNGKEYNGTMIAGHFAFDGNGSTIQPRSDWCLAVNKIQKH